MQKSHCNNIVEFLMSVCFFPRTDCEHFNMEVPEFALAVEVKEDLESSEVMWSLFEEFNSGLKTLAKEDWISFRFVPCVLQIGYLK